jgi:hypothetical protein
MTLMLRLAAILFLLSLPARAQEVHIATTVICDTQKQAERLAALYEGDAESAQRRINAEERNPTACVVATMAFARGNQLATVRNRNATYRVVELLARISHTVEPAFDFDVCLA